MCVICHLPTGTEISENELRNCWVNNDDGGGYMFVDDNGHINIKKYMKYDQYAERFKQDFNKFAGRTPFVLHFRIGTDGVNNIKNVHPFQVNSKLAFCHNGILPCRPEHKDERSDTRIFNDKFLSQLPKDFLRYPGITNLIRGYIGSSYGGANKLAFLDSDKNVVILNKHLGEDSEGRWFSNNSFREYNHYGSYGDWGEWGNYPAVRYGGNSGETNNSSAFTPQTCIYCNVTVPQALNWSFIYDMCSSCRNAFFVGINPKSRSERLVIAKYVKSYNDKQKARGIVAANN